jgi:predicted nucleic acid-binding protein
VYLVDTNVLSAGSPGRTPRPAAVAAWMERNSARLWLSVVTVAEAEDGIAKPRRAGNTARADGLAAWLETLLHLYGARVLPLDVAAARVTGILSDRARALGRAPGFADLSIAGTALSRGLAVLTRNLRDFEGLGVTTLDPFAQLPPEGTQAAR